MNLLATMAIVEMSFSQTLENISFKVRIFLLTKTSWEQAGSLEMAMIETWSPIILWWPSLELDVLNHSPQS
jgi:hypothetical protein